MTEEKGLTVEKIKQAKRIVKSYPRDSKNFYIPLDVAMRIRNKFK